MKVIQSCQPNKDFFFEVCFVLMQVRRSGIRPSWLRNGCLEKTWVLWVALAGQMGLDALTLWSWALRPLGSSALCCVTKILGITDFHFRMLLCNWRKSPTTSWVVPMLLFHRPHFELQMIKGLTASSFTFPGTESSTSLISGWRRVNCQWLAGRPYS